MVNTRMNNFPNYNKLKVKCPTIATALLRAKKKNLRSKRESPWPLWREGATRRRSKAHAKRGNVGSWEIDGLTK